MRNSSTQADNRNDTEVQLMSYKEMLIKKDSQIIDMDSHLKE